MAEIHDQPDENATMKSQYFLNIDSDIPITQNNNGLSVPLEDISVEHLTFRYNQLSDNVLQNISIRIPAGKVTAIVGASGSGKTTLLKLLLGFYQPVQGEIHIGSTPLQTILPAAWRKRCGTVMQDGFIFSDSIANNIAESDEYPNKDRLKQAVNIANIESFIHSLPLGYNTNIGARGNGISQGQRQRLLIARAVYKNPDYLFFDEATNALDANNERVIVEKLAKFYKGELSVVPKTVVIVAHRLSTVTHADQIIVLDKGQVAESGTHRSLVEKKGFYYQLVKNQLELGN
jgi:ATP-binding cassette subfamily B protein